MDSSHDSALARALADTAHPFTGAMRDFDPLLEQAGAAQVVLLGAASHGTHEFYRLRALVTKRLILEKGFSAVAVVADWPDAYRVNRFVHGLGSDATAAEALITFRHFPAWAWRNTEVLEFVRWLRGHNRRRTDPRLTAGFHGLDHFSLRGSIAAVLAYLDQTDPQAALRARYRFASFDQFGENPEAFGYSPTFRLPEDAEEMIIRQLRELQRRQERTVRERGIAAEDKPFEEELNARAESNAAANFHAIFQGRTASWNLRTEHMAETLDSLLAHLDRRGQRSRVVIWAHNSHVGDLRATELGENGQLSLGQLARLRYPGQTFLVGSTSYQGTVTATSEWGGTAERRRLRPALEGSYEQLFHQTGMPGFSLMLRDIGEAAGGLREERLERAVGIVYSPQTELLTHYFRARLPDQFDAVLHVDETNALEPLERSSHWDRGEPPVSFPSRA